MNEPDKAEKVRAMFDRLAPRYDLMNRLMTLGQDQRWRRFVVDRAVLGDGATVLDLAAGTGDIAFEVKRRHPSAEVIAGDFSIGMLAQGKRRDAGGRLRWVACDAMRLPFADGVFDAVAFGYLLRNVADIHRTLREIARVLKPGGRAVCLDTTPPPPGPLRPLIHGYLRFALPLMGRLVAGNAGAYAYLSGSTLAFETPEKLRDLFADAGFIDIGHRLFMFKTVAVHWAVKPPVQKTGAS